MLKASDALRGFQRSGPLGYLQQVIYRISYVIFYFKLHYMNILQNHVLHDQKHNLLNLRVLRSVGILRDHSGASGFVIDCQGLWGNVMVLCVTLL